MILFFHFVYLFLGFFFLLRICFYVLLYDMIIISLIAVILSILHCPAAHTSLRIFIHSPHRTLSYMFCNLFCYISGSQPVDEDHFQGPQNKNKGSPDLHKVWLYLKKVENHWFLCAQRAEVLYCSCSRDIRKDTAMHTEPAPSKNNICNKVMRTQESASGLYQSWNLLPLWENWWTSCVSDASW